MNAKTHMLGLMVLNQTIVKKIEFVNFSASLYATSKHYKMELVLIAGYIRAGLSEKWKI